MPDPYAVLVSEAMLQQTQVATVIPYFERFVAALPTVTALAEADEQRVLRLWQGLGYYRRARNLHAAAKLIVERHAGRVPDDVESLEALPGVGRYTAGAIASIAFGRRSPIVDGNVARVLSRWFAIDEPVDAAKARGRLWALAEAVLPAEGEGSPGDFNQAVMELGATVCVPRDPRCLVCPVSADCLAHGAGAASAYPRMPPKKARKAVSHHVIAVCKPGSRGGSASGRLLMERRPERGLWSNMWQLTTWEEPPAAADAAALQRWVRERFGPVATEPVQIGRFVHVTTHRDIAFTVWLCHVSAGRLRPQAGVWRAIDNVDDLPLARPQLRAIELAKQRLQ
jgi:A/G-specific adenine glycosylase